MQNVIFEGKDFQKNIPTIKKFIQDQQVKILNVADPRESEASGIGNFTRKVLHQVLQKFL